MKKVSVILPIYNAEKNILICLNSILNQTYQNIEIILVDDGSTDRTLSILSQCADKDSRIKLIYQKHTGISAARNNGLDKATGDLITFVQPDDSVEPNYISDLVQQIEEAKSDMKCNIKVGQN